MKIISENVRFMETDSGNVWIETDIGTFFRSFNCDLIDEAVTINDTESFDNALSFETYENEYLELDAIDYSNMITDTEYFQRQCAEAKAENREYANMCRTA